MILKTGWAALAVFLMLSIIGTGIASAETISIDYEDTGHYDVDRNTYKARTAAGSETTIKFYCEEIEKFSNIKSVIWDLDVGGVLWTVYDPDIVTSETNVIYKIGTTQVGTGSLQFSYLTTSEDVKYGVLLALFDNGLDLGTISGTQTLIAEYSGVDLNIKQNGVGTYAQIPSVYDAPRYMVPKWYSTSNHDSMNAKNGVIYYGASLHQELSYGYNGDNTLYIDYDRNGKSNAISVIGDSGDGVPAYEYYDDEDFYLSPLYETPYEVFIDNPFTTGSTEGVDRWIYSIPEEEPEEEPETITGTYYVYDTSTGSLISNVHCVENTTLDGGGLDDSSGSVPYQHTFDTDAYNRWELYFYADGYENSTICRYHQPPYAANPEWSLLWNSFQENIYLTPTGTPSNTTATVSFKVNKEMGFAGAGVYWYGSGASVTLDGVTKLTSSQGLTSFTVDNNDTYAYTVTLADRVPVQGSVTVGTTNEHVEVTLYFPAKDDPVPTETLPSGVYDNRPFNEKADDALAVVFDNIVAITYLAVLVLIVSMLKWLKI